MESEPQILQLHTKCSEKVSCGMTAEEVAAIMDERDKLKKEVKELRKKIAEATASLDEILKKEQK